MMLVEIYVDGQLAYAEEQDIVFVEDPVEGVRDDVEAVQAEVTTVREDVQLTKTQIKDLLLRTGILDTIRDEITQNRQMIKALNVRLVDAEARIKNLEGTGA